MKIQTCSIVCGTTACNAHCPFCVSKTTPDANLSTNINWHNFKVACKLAEKSDATTCLITGKGEPTLYPNLIREYLLHANNYFPFIELQTNGILLKQLNEIEEWYKLGLTTVCLSAVHYWQDMNQTIYGDNYTDLKENVKLLRDIGFTVRLSIMMLKNYIDTPEEVNEIANFCKNHNIKQLTIRPIAHPKNDKSAVGKWIKEHTLDDDKLQIIKHFITDNATPVLKLSHGGVVYDYFGQNLCLTDCLTTNDIDDNMRQIIFYPDGTIGYDWCYKGAVLL